MNQRILIGLAGAAIAALLVALIYILGGGSDGPSDQDIVSSPSDPSRDTPLMPGEGDESGDAVFIAPNDPVERLERYRKWAVFPPFSRPLHAGQRDLLEPFNAARPAVGVVKTPAANCTTGADGKRDCAQPAEISDVQCDMTPESTISVGREDFRVTVSCVDPRGERLALDDLQAKVYRKLFRKTYGSLPPVSINDQGESGDASAKDRIYTVVVRPTAQDWGHMFVEIDAQVGDFQHNQRANWYSTPHTVATINGAAVRDSIQDGHLKIAVPLTVQKAGYYEVQANLQEQGGEQRLIASATWEGDLEAGNQIVDLIYWGKILHDSDVDGPYLVRNLRAKRNNSPVSPSMIAKSRAENKPVPMVNHTEPMWEYVALPEQDIVTGVYSASQFSTAEWSSDEKEARLKFLESQVR
ncbi:MAG: hypothetical protein NXI24_18910 [bacterium]|nr:hypothetical protein [bacterium]